jgi:hypothetical protein
MNSSIKHNRDNSQRDAKIVQGWDAYYRIGLKYAYNWFRFYFPTTEDLKQSAALAATVAKVTLGDAVTYKQLVKTLRQTIRQEASAYGLRQRKFYRPDGRRTSQDFQLDVPFATVLGDLREEGEGAEVQEWFESKLLLLGVGEWTRRQAGMLNF